MLPKANEQRKKKTIGEIFHQKKIQKVLMKIEEMAGVFLNSANFASHAFLTLAPPSGYALNHRQWTPNEGINQRYLKNWADVADKICFGRT